jgi:RNA polymerase sigma-32 factor
MSNLLPIREVVLPLGSIDSYIHWVNQMPLLSTEEELNLAKRFHSEGDLEAARQLLISHLRFVVRIARHYLGYGLPQADLIQEGTIGLMKAVKRFNPNVGVRLISFAVHWIKAEIHEYILKNWRIVKVATTKAQRKLFFNLRKASKRLAWFSNQEINKVAENLKVSPKEVRVMEQRLTAIDDSFEGSSREEEDEWSAPVNYLVDNNSDPILLLENQDSSFNQDKSLEEALAKLKERDRDIIKSRWLAENKMTLQELAEKYQVSAERIRQIENRTMLKLKESLNYGYYY